MKIVTALATFMLCGQLHHIASATEKPNVIIIFTDDQGYQDLGCYGSPDIATPNIDNLADEGMRFTDFYVAASACSASRAALLTGCYPKRVGMPLVLNPSKTTGPQGLDPKHVTIAELLKPLGYATKEVGKWHLGDEKQYLPTNQGFDSYFGIPYSNDMAAAADMEYAKDCLFREGYSRDKIRQVRGEPLLMRDELCIELPVDQSTVTRRYTDESVRFISESTQTKEPFFLYLAHTMPHTPWYVSSDFQGKSKQGLYGDVIEEIDYNVGRLLNHLEELDIADNTLVVFTSDNGRWLLKGEDGGSALPLLEGKKTTFEGGMRVSCIMRWPGRIPAGSVCTEMASSIDLLPTIAAITGAGSAKDVPLDGREIIDLITGKEDTTTPHRYFFYETQAVRSGDWKFHSRQSHKVKSIARPHKGNALYNLTDDIGESNNVIDDYPEVAARLKKALEVYVSSYKK
ncbi:sulfatase [Novipirellula herctigrandis]